LKSSLWQSTPIDCPPGSPHFLSQVASDLVLPGESKSIARLLAELPPDADFLPVA